MKDISSSVKEVKAISLNPMRSKEISEYIKRVLKI